MCAGAASAASTSTFESLTDVVESVRSSVVSKRPVARSGAGYAGGCGAVPGRAAGRVLAAGLALLTVILVQSSVRAAGGARLRRDCRRGSTGRSCGASSAGAHRHSRARPNVGEGGGQTSRAPLRRG